MNSGELEFSIDKLYDLKKGISAGPADRVFIYGTGEVGLLVYFLLKRNYITPHAFVVSRKVSDCIPALSMPVLEYDSLLFKEEDVVIIAAFGQAQKEIRDICSNDVCKKGIVKENFYRTYIRVFRSLIENILWEEKICLYRAGKEEKKTVGEYFEDAKLNHSDFEKRWYALIKNLEPSSREAALRCIQRVRKLNACEDKEMDIFTEPEKREIKKAWKSFKSEIVQLGENIWSYKGYFLPINDFASTIFYDKLGLPVVETLGNCKYKDIIDVGGYIGDSAIILSEITEKKVHVFEPVESNVKLLEKTAELNQIDFEIVRMAVSDRKKSILFSLDKANSTIAEKRLKDREYEETMQVNAISIDQYVSENNLEIGLIKVHAEGAEQEVLRGAAKVIKKQAPVIIAEICHTESDFFDIKPMLEEMNPHYKFRIFKPNNGLICLGLKLIAEVR